MSNSRRMAWMLLAAVAAFGVASSAIAADPPATFAYVDLAKVYSDAPRIKQYTEELNKFRQTLASKLDIRSQNMMLDENEIKELIDLKIKEEPTKQDTERIKVIEDLERARDAELKELQGTAQPNEAQKARLKELQDMQQKSKDTGSAIAKDYDSQLQTKMQELNGKADADIRDGIQKLASAKKLTLVVAKEAVLYGGTDVTDEVIGKLDRKMQ